jgi:ribosome-associated protein
LKEILIQTETINLDQFLKWSGILSTGGEAKVVIAEGSVKVNGVIETKRSRKLKASDVVELGGYRLVVVRR